MMKRTRVAAASLLAMLLAAAPAPPPNTLTPAERTAGWTLLFNGRDLSGWGAFAGGGAPATWRVEDGAIVLTKDDGQMSGTDLVTAKRYGAFELVLDWKVAAGGNSGVVYLARDVPGARQVYQTGLEMQVLDDAGHADGKIPSHRAGALYDITVPPSGAARPAGQWNHARLLVERGRVRQWLNGVPTADVSYGDAAWRKRVAASKFAKMPQFGTFDSGVIALQDHGEPVAFRNVKLRPIGPSALAARP